MHDALKGHGNGEMQRDRRALAMAIRAISRGSDQPRPVETMILDKMTPAQHRMEMDDAKVCRTCRWWDAHSAELRLGDCRAPSSAIGPHRYNRVPMGDGSFALLDSFGEEETPPNFTCGAWNSGEAILSTAPSDRGGKG